MIEWVKRKHNSGSKEADLYLALRKDGRTAISLSNDAYTKLGKPKYITAQLLINKTDKHPCVRLCVTGTTEKDGFLIENSYTRHRACVPLEQTKVVKKICGEYQIDYWAEEDCWFIEVSANDIKTQEKEPRTKRLEVSVSPITFAKVSRCARELGTSTSDYCNNIIEGFLED